MGSLPVREMVLYKHGVGFFVRQGQVDGNEVELVFRQDEIDDVLKSLAVFDQSGGQVLGIHYQTPMDRHHRLDSTSIRLSSSNSLRDLLESLSGRQVELTVSGFAEPISGRMVGLEQLEATPYPQPSKRHLVTIQMESGQIRVVDLEAVQALHITDAQASADLTYFLDTSMSEDVRRTIRVRLNDQEQHDVLVYYVAPTATWRVSYRIVAEAQEDRASGDLLLQAWGLFDNRLDEDLEDVNLTMVAGQPISFIYRLYESQIPQRATVKDTARIAPGPIEFAGVEIEEHSEGVKGNNRADALYLLEAQPEETSRGPASSASVQFDDRFQAEESVVAADMPALRRMSRGQASQAGPAQAEGKESAEFFQYVVTTPLNVKRGESAMVPIINSDLVYERILLYNGRKFRRHPVAAIRFVNHSGLTLERGPVTVIEDGEYRGEAVIPFTQPDAEVFVPFAAELGIVITEEQFQGSTTASISIGKNIFDPNLRQLVEQRYNHITVTHTIENNSDRDRVVTIEMPTRQNWTLFNTPDPDVETAEVRRWRVLATQRDTTTLVVQERRLTALQHSIKSLTERQLVDWLEGQWLDQATFDALSDILTTLQGLSHAKAEQKRLRDRRKSLYERQEQLRQNLGALSTDGDEARLRRQMLDQLEEAENEVIEIGRRIDELAAQIRAGNTQVEQMIADLNRGG
ncbi:MAG: hypothetical protein GYB68_15835 [Chloroflexi bacterium]|nr:hypothetical protein [Chloroflexota bacterium]